MGVVPAEKAGVGSAVNDATRELGGTLGVAVIGSVSLSLYREAFEGDRLPAAVLEPARESIGSALGAAARLAASGDGGAASALVATARGGYLDGLQAGCLVAAGVVLVGAVLVLLWLPAHPGAGREDADGRTSGVPDLDDAVTDPPTPAPAPPAPGPAPVVTGDLAVGTSAAVHRIVAAAEASAAEIEAEARSRAWATAQAADADAAAVRAAAVADAVELRDATHDAMTRAIARLTAVEEASARTLAPLGIDPRTDDALTR